MEFVTDKRFLVGLLLGYLICHFLARGGVSLKKKSGGEAQ